MAWALAVPATWLLGRWLIDRGAELVLGGTPPFIGRLDVRLGPATLVALLVGAALIRWGPRLTASLPWSTFLLASWLASAGFAVALAVTDGWAALTKPLRSEHDYLAVVPAASTDLGAFVRTFTASLSEYPIHVRGHPPGLVVALTWLDRAGLGGPGWAAGLTIAAGTSALVAVGVALRALAGADGERLVRRAMPVAVLAPAAVWIATAPDAIFAGVLAWGVALLAVASTGGHRWPWALAAGALLAACPFLSYGLLPMGLLALVVPVCTRRLGPTVVAGVVVLGAIVAWAAAGFWLGDGITATHEAWNDGRASARPYGYFLLVDAVLLGALIGPAGVGGLTRPARLSREARAFVLTALAAAAIGALGGFMRGEVERIWLPLFPWVVLVAAALPGRRDRPVARGWLVAQLVTAMTVQAVVDSPW